MGKKIFMGLAITALLILLSACGGTIAKSSSLSTPTSQSFYVHTPPPHTNSPIVGIYTTTITSKDLVSHPELMAPSMVGGINILGTWTLTLNNDGNFTALNGKYYSGQQYVGTGFFSVTHNQLAILSDPKCLEFYVPLHGPDAQTAMYIWSLQGKILRLSAIQELCTARNVLFSTHTWTRQS